jgi:L-threonylcarbamoyladenylate synthase
MGRPLLVSRLNLGREIMPFAADIKPRDHCMVGNIRKPDPQALEEAARLLRSGELVAFPTETVYGLGGDATNATAVARIFAAKGRPQFNPLIVHVPDTAAARAIGKFSKTAERLAQEFWPGPLTVVVERQPDNRIADLVSAGQTTIAIRVPANPIARKLLTLTGRPLAAPSANRSGHVSSTEAKHVETDLNGEVAMILDGGATLHGLESTILDATGSDICMLRPGAIAKADIEAVLGQPLKTSKTNSKAPTAPGQLESHYAPRAALRLNATAVAADEALLAFGKDTPTTSGPSINLSSTGNLIEAAAKLFSALRILDTSGAATIAVMPIPMTGLGEAINDRLARAAAPRPA